MRKIFSVVGLALLLAMSFVSLVIAESPTGIFLPVIGVDPASLVSVQNPGVQATEIFTISNLGNMVLNWHIYEDAWAETFDGYALGSQLHGQGGWKGWNNNPAGSAVVTDTYSTSAPHSVVISGTSDLIHEFDGRTSGAWVYTAWQIIPPGFTGDTYFIVLNQYSDGGPYNWSTQVQFSSSAGQVINTGASGGTLPLLINQRVELRLEIDLDGNTQAFYYDDTLLYSGTWTDEVSGSGVPEIAAISLFANGSSEAYYDDFSLEPDISGACASQAEISWAEVMPVSGATSPAGHSPVDVTFDSTSLGTGVYTDTLCIQTNDPTALEVSLPLTLTVEPYWSYLPVVRKE